MKGNHLGKKGLVVGIILLFLGTSSIPSVAQITNEKASQVLSSGGNHAPIRIIGNDEFTSENGVTGGNGTADDPFLIEDWVIVNDGTAANGIFINNTDAYFVIKNCTISGFHQGIDFLGVTHGRIEETVVHDCQTGINIVECSDITIKKTKCTNNTGSGLHSEKAPTRFLIEDCTFQNNNDHGIALIHGYVPYQSYSLIRNCSFSNQHQGIWLVNLCNNTIENCVFSHNYMGLELDYESRNNTIRNCSFLSQTAVGIYIWEYPYWRPIPFNNEISYCDFFDNIDGIFLMESRGETKIHHCNFINNSHCGVGLSLSRAQITSNNFVNNGRNWSSFDHGGVVLSQSYFCDVRYNWWGTPRGPAINITIDLIFDGMLIKIRKVQGSDTVFFNGVNLVRLRPWLSESIPDAGSQT